MKIKQTKQQIKQLKQQLKAAKHNRNSHLLKLALILIILVMVAAFITGRIQLW